MVGDWRRVKIRAVDPISTDGKQAAAEFQVVRCTFRWHRAEADDRKLNAANFKLFHTSQQNCHVRQLMAAPKELFDKAFWSGRTSGLNVQCFTKME